MNLHAEENLKTSHFGKVCCSSVVKNKSEVARLSPLREGMSGHRVTGRSIRRERAFKTDLRLIGMPALRNNRLSELLEDS